jgi:hypothetical protein
MKAHGWQVSFAISPAILQTTLSLVKVCLALRVTAVILYGMTFVQSLHILVSVLLNNVSFFFENVLHAHDGF